MKRLFFDTETTGLPNNYKAHHSDSNNWPRLVQLSGIIELDDFVQEFDFIIKPEGYRIPDGMIHGISQEKAERDGKLLSDVINFFGLQVQQADLLVCHNFSFDSKIVAAELHRMGEKFTADLVFEKPSFCTMLGTVDIVKLGWNDYYQSYKWPKLNELYYTLFGKNIEGAHNSLMDVRAMYDCFKELKRRELI